MGVLIVKHGLRVKVGIRRMKSWFVGGKKVGQRVVKGWDTKGEWLVRERSKVGPKEVKRWPIRGQKLAHKRSNVGP